MGKLVLKSKNFFSFLDKLFFVYFLLCTLICFALQYQRTINALISLLHLVNKTKKKKKEIMLILKVLKAFFKNSVSLPSTLALQNNVETKFSNHVSPDHIPQGKATKKENKEK